MRPVALKSGSSLFSSNASFFSSDLGSQPEPIRLLPLPDKKKEPAVVAGSPEKVSVINIEWLHATAPPI